MEEGYDTFSGQRMPDAKDISGLPKDFIRNKFGENVIQMGCENTDGSYQIYFNLLETPEKYTGGFDLKVITLKGWDSNLSFVQNQEMVVDLIDTVLKSKSWNSGHLDGEYADKPNKNPFGENYGDTFKEFWNWLKRLFGSEEEGASEEEKEEQTKLKESLEVSPKPENDEEKYVKTRIDIDKHYADVRDKGKQSNVTLAYILQEIDRNLNLTKVDVKKTYLYLPENEVTFLTVSEAQEVVNERFRERK